MSPPPTFDFLGLVRNCYLAVLADPRRFLDIAWPWLGLSVLAVYGVERLYPGPEEIASGQGGGGLSAVQLLLSLVNLAAMCGFLAKWTRWVALKEMPEGVFVLIFGRRELRVLGVTFLSGLIVGLPLAAALVYFLTHREEGGLSAFIFMAVALSVGFVWLRLSLAPVLAALDVPGNALKASWYLTRKRAGLLLSLVVASAFPMLVLQAVIAQFIGLVFGFEESSIQGTPAQGMQILFAILIGFLMMALVLTAQTLAAQKFMSQGPSNPEASPPQDPA